MRREYDKRLRSPVTMRLDLQVIGYFKALAAKTGVPYQSLINYVLKDYAIHRLEPTANWERLTRSRRAS